MKISVIGLGKFGEILGKKLLSLGHTVSGTTRSEDKKKLLEEKGFEVNLLSFPERAPVEVLNSSVVVLNIPPFEQQLSWFKSWPWKKNSWVLFISSTSAFSPKESKGGELLLEEEEWVKSSFDDYTILRLGGILRSPGHPGKYLSGRTSLPGRLWPVNLIHQEDAVEATLAVIEKQIKNTLIHVVNPEHPTREEYYTQYCKTQELPVPEFDPSDFSQGKKIPDEDLKGIYQPKKSIWEF